MHFILLILTLAATSVSAQNSPTELPKSAAGASHITSRVAFGEDSEDEAEENESDWSYYLESWNEIDRSSSASTLSNLIGIEYEPADNIIFEVAQEWEHTTRSRLKDTYLQAKHAKVFTVGRDFHAEALVRGYLPTGEESRDLGQLFRLRAEFTLSQIFSRSLFLSFILRPELYAQKYLVYFDTDENDVAGTKQLEGWSFFELHWKFLKQFAFHQILGLKNVIRHGDAHYGLLYEREENLLNETAVSFEYSDSLTVRGGVTQEAPNLLDQRRTLSLYGGDESSYYLSAEVSF